MAMKYNEYVCAFGVIRIVSNEAGLCKISVTEEEWQAFSGKTPLQYDPNCSCEVIEQLDEYFAGTRKGFDLSFSLIGTEFQMKVWQSLCTIPYGETASYADIASAVNSPKAVRAVGQANRANPLPIVIPCHRVIGKNQELTGYAGTRTDIKEHLLQLEGVSFGVQTSLF